ncbi:hypothetical protein [Planctomonas psychrotolerans]|uniref:hypothetical protein n=1 Tax=Planctomonas psychrotolerans TaxID=2528712 RepID=UPI001D0D2C38|nr:hypothetical protein [Planctomonas psychrotolerans]
MLPVLSPGKHRNPRKGACFMEFASYLAGERWSDHPSCTHGGLAHLARMANDRVTDAGRRRMAPLIPSVIGIVTDDPRLNMILALKAACAAIPVASEGRQRALAVGALVTLPALERLGGSSPLDMAREVRSAFEQAPGAESWARDFLAQQRRAASSVTVQHSHAVISVAVDGIAYACIDDADDRIFALLASAIEASVIFTGKRPEQRPVAPAPEKPAPEEATNRSGALTDA